MTSQNDLRLSEERYRSLFNSIRLGDPSENKVAVLFTDITEPGAAREELALARTELSQIIYLAPSFMTVYPGPEFIIEVANDAHHRLAGRRTLIRRTLRGALSCMRKMPL